MERVHRVEKIFGHVRESSVKLTSTVLVEEFLLEHKDVYAIGTLSLNLTFPHSGDYDDKYRDSLAASDLHDQKRIAYTFCANIDDHKKEPTGYHFGDCTSMAMSCSRCISENIYIEGLEVLDEFTAFITEKNIICPDPCSKLLSILFATEHLWYQYINLFKISIKDDKIPGMDYNKYRAESNQLWDKLWSWQYRYDLWNNLTLEEKELCHKRAVRFRAYFDNRPTVEGIPWW